MDQQFFFAKRCKHVISIETDPNWALVVNSHLKNLGLNNVRMISNSSQVDIENLIKQLDTEDVNIVSVDTIYGYNRSAFLDRFLEKGISKNLRLIVLDNYASPELFPTHYNKEAVDLVDWSLFIYNDNYWCGKGTKLYVRK